MKMRAFVHAFAIAVTLAIAAPSFAADSIGVVGALQGTASAAGASGVRPLKVGDQVFLDEEVTTEAGSKLQLMLNDRSTITLNPNSKVKVREFAYDTTADSGSMAMEGVKGAFRFIGGALSKQNPVTIKTPVSSIGIRGGIADTHIGPQGQTDAVFLYGDAMTMTNQNGQTVEITQPGQGLSMQTPNDVPTFTPPAVIQQYLNTFNPVPAGNAGAGGTEGAANAPAPEGGTEQQPANPGGANSDGQQQAATGGNQPDNQPGGNQPGTDTNGGQPGAAPNNAPGGRPFQPQTAAQQQYGAFANNQLPPGAAPGVITGGAPGAAPGGGTSALNPVGGINVNQIVTQTTTTAGTTNFNGTNAAGTVVTTAEYRGRYGTTEPQSGSNVKERGAVNVVKNGDQFLLNATEFAPNNGATHAGKVAQVSTAGHTVFNTPFLLNSADPTTYTGFAYAAPGLSSFYYHLDEVGGTEKFNMFFGRQIPLTSLQTAMNNTVTLSNSQGTNGISYYKFAPDLLTYANTASTPQGFFDYGMVDINPNYSTDNGRSAPFGVAVDWANKAFLSGYLKWNNGGGLSRDFVMAFGKVGDASSTSQFSGVNFSLNQNGQALTSFDVGKGTINSGAGTVYGNANNQIESLMLEGVAPDNKSIEAPAIRMDASSLPAPINEDRATQTMKGFAAGHFVGNANGTPVVKTIWNTHSNGVTINTNASTGSVSGTLALFDKNTTANTIDASFGNPGSDSAYLSKDLYASQQSSVAYGGGLTGNYSATNGFIANASAIGQVTNNCTTCEFVHWGVWSGEVNRGTTANPVIDAAYAVPYVAGAVTQDMGANIVPQSFGAVSYDGYMYGTEFNSTTNSLQRVEGSFSAGIDLDVRRVDTFNASVGSLAFSATPNATIPISGPANFDFSVTGAGGLTGQVNGALFGPNAENIGGNYSVSQTGGVSGAGVYIGER